MHVYGYSILVENRRGETLYEWNTFSDQLRCTRDIFIPEEIVLTLPLNAEEIKHVAITHMETYSIKMFKKLKIILLKHWNKLRKIVVY